MVIFKEVIKHFSHLRYIYDNLSFSTPMGRENLLNTPFCSDKETLSALYGRVDNVIDRDLKVVKSILSHFRDISQTITRAQSGATLSEIELFELKSFSYYIERLRELKIVDIESLKPLFKLLDPDSSGVVNFYIYSSYSNTLATLREQLKDDDDDTIYVAIAAEEERVRERLSKEIKEYGSALNSAFKTVSDLDLDIAKGEFIKREGLTAPQFVEYGEGEYKGLFNPYLRGIVADYQPIDISFIKGVTLITGANMSGKSMLLKSVALAQYMVQFGFYAPAESGRVSLVDDIFMLLGDNEKESAGLSSYGAEITALSGILDSVERGGKYLTLLDELARTTSPNEGVAIVDATTKLLDEWGAVSLITTHYNSKRVGVRKLRVKGFVQDRIDERITLGNISRFIDYSLSEVTTESPSSSEAIRIAEILNVNERLINLSKEILCTERVN